jgi:hypothetical protein
LVSIAVFDIDGVVADVRHRLHHLDGRKSWTGFFAEADADGLLPEGARLVADLGALHKIVWLTGRPQRLRQVTAKWLADHSLPAGELHMRRDGDYRPAARYKLDTLGLLRPREIAAFIDDDADVIDAALAAGLPAALADWVPRAAALRDAQDRLGRT